MERELSANGRNWDVVIMGGGLSGLSLAIQLRTEMPDLSVLVIEKNRHPVAGAAHKVGESSIEAGAHYFAEVVGMKEHLETEHYVKPGLRFYFPRGNNERIEERVEHADSEYPTYVAYQIDRGRFENALAERAKQLGVTFADDARVLDVSFDDPWHTVSYQVGGAASNARCRWFIDASGRRRFLTQKLGLKQETAHKVNAVWFRVDGKIDIETWSSDREWQRRRGPDYMRFHSTNHLMCTGGWVWLIPLAPNLTSVGIVTDERFHELNELNTLEKALAWLKRVEPQCHRELLPHLERVLDFKVLKHYAHRCSQVYSAERWCITGEAGMFVDPMYSSGSDTIAISNTYITKLIQLDRAGGDVARHVDAFNDTYLNGIGRLLFNVFQDLYPVMGNAQVFSTKITWDTYWYWSVYCLMYFQQKLTDLEFMESVRPEMERMNALAWRMQQLFRDWAARYNPPCKAALIDQSLDELMDRLHLGLRATFENDDALRAQIRENVQLVEQVAQAIALRATQCLNTPLTTKAFDPAAISLEPERWERDGLFARAPRHSLQFDVEKELSLLWMQPELVQCSLSGLEPTLQGAEPAVQRDAQVTRGATAEGKTVHGGSALRLQASDHGGE